MTKDDKKLAYKLADELTIEGYKLHSIALRAAIDEIERLEKRLVFAGTRTNKLIKKLDLLEKAQVQ